MKKSNTLTHFAAAALVTILVGLIEVSVQQSYRMDANDPQLQMARDIAARIEKGQSIDRLMTNDSIDIAKSLAPFTVLYDNNNVPIQSNGLLDGKLPGIPAGVLQFAKNRGENVLSWQPRAGVRVALVVEPVHSASVSFVAVGRSLLEVEKRESNLATMALICWLLCLGIVAFHWLIVFFRN